jgi:rod shape-determining protein MreC
VALSRRNGRSRATLAFLVLTSVTVITLDARDDGAGVVDRVRDTATDAFAPVRDAAGAVLAPVGNVFSGITNYDDLEDEVARLRSELAERRVAPAQARDAEAQLDELLAQAELAWVRDYSQVPARVVSAPVSNFEQTIELDKGRRDGIAVDMPVIASGGLVGRVVDVSGKRSVVRLITDPRSAIGVRIGAAAETGIAEGEGPGRSLSVGFVEVNAEVKRGDLAITSGLEGGSDLYPADVPVGRVVRARKIEGALQQRVELEPLADVGHLRFVKVIRMPQ